MNRFILLLAGTVSTSVALSVPLAYSAADIIECRSIVNPEARLTCYDQVIDSEAATLESQVVEANQESIADSAAAAESATPFSDRLAGEQALMNSAFALIPHHRNYILPVTYNSKINEEPFTNAYPGVGMDDIEAKFQISFKVRVFEDLIGGADLWAGYTQENWWQVYNDDESAPFRETNYQPEALLVWDNDWEIAGFTNTNLALGVNHQSNGRGDLLSRSWNRIIASAVFEKQDFVGRIRAWHRIEESDSDDDNPDTEDYYGYGDVMLAYHWGDHEFSTLLRNNLQGSGDNKGAIQLDWTYPMSDRFKWYLQYFYGYGESMIDYDVKTSRIGIGFAMNNIF
jgi:phospholipase A1